jgi:hypothetical protein
MKTLKEIQESAKKTFEDVLAKYEWIGTEIIEIGKQN